MLRSGSITRVARCDAADAEMGGAGSVWDAGQFKFVWLNPSSGGCAAEAAETLMANRSAT